MVGFLLLSGALASLAGAVRGIYTLGDVGYPDSATLLRVRDFIQSGTLYPDITSPPYLVTLYGPLTYLAFAVVHAAAEDLGIEPVFALRCFLLASWLLSVFIVGAISQRLSDSSLARWLSILSGMSILPLANWITQLRGDLLALTASLIGVLLILGKTENRNIVLAAVLASMAVAFKQTFLAAPLAVIVWLVYDRRWRVTIIYLMAFTVSTLCMYGAMLWREPLMLDHLRVLGYLETEYYGALDLIKMAAWQPIVLLSLIGVAASIPICRRAMGLVMIYLGLSWTITVLTIPQIGSNVNYFWEPLFVSAVLSGLGLSRLKRAATMAPPLVILSMILLLVRWSYEPLRKDLEYLSSCYEYSERYRRSEERWTFLLSVLANKQLLSTLPEITLIAKTPTVPDPFLNTILERGGVWSYNIVAAEIEKSQYDVIVVRTGDASGMRRHRKNILTPWSDEVWEAVRRRYRLGCSLEDERIEVWLPSDDSEDFLRRLKSAGCLPAEVP